MDGDFSALLNVDRSIDDPELIIDSFAGGGGASTGIELALGRSPDYAINHDPEALALHAANHPGTVHLSKNIYKVDPLDVVGQRRVGLAWFSPDCKHFSKAKGGKPVKREIRDLAWTVVLWAKRVKPRVIILENVEEFQTWGPLVENDKGELLPCPDRRGETFNQWVGALRKLGYRVEWKELRACDYGAPTTRKRLFLIARCDGQQIRWPAPTHGAPDDAAVLVGKKLPWRTAAGDVIDWSIPCPSIFDTTEEIMAKLGIRSVRPLAENTMARIAKGVKRYVIDAAKPFIVNLTHGVRLEPADEPVMTVTGAHRGEKGVVVPHITKFQSGAVGVDIGAPLPTITANSFIKRPGGAAPPGVVAPVLVGCGGRAGQSRPRSGDEPMATATAKADVCVVTPHLMTMRNAGKPYNEVDRPTHTVTAGGAGLALVAPVLSAAQQGGSVRGADEPIHTITASPKDQNQVIAATMVQTGYGERQGQEPRALDIEKPLGTVVAGGAKHAVVAAFLAQHNAGPRPGAPAHDAREPLSAVTATGSQQTVVAAHLMTNTTGHPGAAADEQVPTIATGGHHSVVSAGLMNMKGEDRASWPVDGGTPTQTAGGQHIAEVRAFLMKYHGSGGQLHSVEKPLPTQDCEDRMGVVHVDGEPYQIVDIGMRMLTPRELFKAQGFPPGYVIDTGVFADGERRTLTKTAQVRMCGNSVCPPIAAALVTANCGDMVTASKVAAE